MAKSLNRVQLIGNLTRDPEMRYTPQGTAVCTFGIATNRSWTTDTGEKKDDVDFHNIVAWNKLGEICASLLKKGRKVYVEGRLSTSSWQAPDGAQRNKTEIIINDMIVLDRKSDEVGVESQRSSVPEEKPVVKEAKKESADAKAMADDGKSVEPTEEDIPF